MTPENSTNPLRPQHWIKTTPSSAVRRRHLLRFTKTRSSRNGWTWFLTRGTTFLCGVPMYSSDRGGHYKPQRTSAPGQQALLTSWRMIRLYSASFRWCSIYQFPGPAVLSAHTESSKQATAYLPREGSKHPTQVGRYPNNLLALLVSLTQIRNLLFVEFVRNTMYGYLGTRRAKRNRGCGFCIYRA